MAPVAKRLSKKHGILEPFQTKNSVAGQIKELRRILLNECELPVVLIGWSWGAWLSFLLAAKYPRLINKLILIGSPPFEQKYAKTIMNTRLQRMSDEDRIRFRSLKSSLDNPAEKSKNALFARLGKSLSMTDSFTPIRLRGEHLKIRYDIYERVWREAAEMRRHGTLLELGKKIRCPVIVIHGADDPHPFEGVTKPLVKVAGDFKFILLKRCGHTPWAERFAREKFFSELEEELARKNSSPMKINKRWHDANRMPKNPSLNDRIRWHSLHSKHCSCRPMPETVLREIEKQKRQRNNK
jgi:pimeloyl-ACP methyl ester carboxylesterase